MKNSSETIINSDFLSNFYQMCTEIDLNDVGKDSFYAHIPDEMISTVESLQNIAKTGG